MADQNADQFIEALNKSIEEETFIKVTLSNKKVTTSNLTNLYVKPVLIKEQLNLQFVYRHTNKDITKNFPVNEALIELKQLVLSNFNQGLLATTQHDYQLLINKKGNSTLLRKPASSASPPSLSHDRIKQRIINTANPTYLAALGITNKEGKIKHDMHDKYRQINKYIEILDGIIKEVNLPASMKVADMGAGKGYLTFALYDYLTTTLNKNVEMTGVELREELVNKCNTIAIDSNFTGLKFIKGSIEKSQITETDILIALHACDTATDEAIYKGIRSGAKIIICSPCCHKQVRKSMETTGTLAEITQFGILAERQAEILTDTIRALILEAYGYRTNVAEFIATEHTPKNIIISAIKKNLNPKYHSIPDSDVIQKVNDLRQKFNIRSHYLQQLLESDIN